MWEQKQFSGLYHIVTQIDSYGIICYRRGAILPLLGAYIKKGNLFIPPVQYPT